jgi:hypothetical protein
MLLAVKTAPERPRLLRTLRHETCLHRFHRSLQQWKLMSLWEPAQAGLVAERSEVP